MPEIKLSQTTLNWIRGCREINISRVASMLIRSDDPRTGSYVQLYGYDYIALLPEVNVTPEGLCIRKLVVGTHVVPDRRNQPVIVDEIHYFDKVSESAIASSYIRIIRSLNKNSMMFVF